MKKFKLTLSIIVIALFICCKKNTEHINVDDTSTPAKNNGGGSQSQPSNATYYAKGKIDGVSFIWEVTNNHDSYSFGSSASSSFENGIAIGGVSGSISKIITNQMIQPVLDVEFKTMRVSYLEDKFTYLKSFITEGNWTFDTTDSYLVGSKNLRIKYVNKDGKVYFSSKGIQTGSTASVISTKVVPEQLGIPPSLDVKVSISCKLYPEDGTGNAVMLTDAELSLNIFNMI
ncbi:hypothetical protein [Pedobacter helvus]|uniref:Lipid/polyisoprenoid-binding YceI-like domain-containing protein n=1 Tax=Pedobacter helvus TaxID=2563444 RepID=A0ABW9JNZ1_9SPHI|nr:hypothetical protein [Pedobacter ureilyticus]